MEEPGRSWEGISEGIRLNNNQIIVPFGTFLANFGELRKAEVHAGVKGRIAPPR